MQTITTGYVVMIHRQDVGTFAPAFRNLDDAEEFSNAMRIITDGASISEPVPLEQPLKGLCLPKTI